jgi:sirohydrochlorin cobaltochelatase
MTLVGGLTVTHKAVILVGHGSRDPSWRQPMQAVAARLELLSPDLLVSCAYLEFDEPKLAQAAVQVIAAGARHVTIVPMFLGSGKHVRDDLPALTQAMSEAHPQIHFILKGAVGDDPRVLDLLASIAFE